MLLPVHPYPLAQPSLPAGARTTSDTSPGRAIPVHGATCTSEPPTVTPLAPTQTTAAVHLLPPDRIEHDEIALAISISRDDLPLSEPP